MNKKTFYMVFREKGGEKPSRRHESYDDAFKEAYRLALKENSPFYIVQAQAYVVRSSEIQSTSLS